MIKRILTFQPSWTLRLISGTIAVVAFISMCLLTGAVDLNGAMAERGQEFTGRNIEAGAKVYYEQCARCHGAKGEGADGLGPALSYDGFLGKWDAAKKTLGPSERLKKIGWTSSLAGYVEAVVASGMPVKSSAVWEAPHPPFALAFGGPLREDQVKNVAAFVLNWGPGQVAPVATMPEPGAAGGAAAAVALTANQEKGKQVFLGAAGCQACHAIRGVATGAIGPSLNKLATTADARIKDAAYKGTAKTGAEYIKEAIVNPNVFVVAECPQGACLANVMPSTFGQTLQAADLDALLDYLSTLK
ncbi:MAG: cytochrome c [Thermoflexales bacterium]|nr:cytochrome c [Thermoflexales bacterium]